MDFIESVASAIESITDDQLSLLASMVVKEKLRRRRGSHGRSVWIITIEWTALGSLRYVGLLTAEELEKLQLRAFSNDGVISSTWVQGTIEDMPAADTRLLMLFSNTAEVFPAQLSDTVVSSEDN